MVHWNSKIHFMISSFLLVDLTKSVFLARIGLSVCILLLFTLLEFFTSANADGLSLEFE